MRAQPRLAAATAAPRPAARTALRCVALVTESRLPPAPLRRVAFDGAPAGDETLALHTAKESTAVGLVHRYLTLVRQNARRCVGVGRVGRAFSVEAFAAAPLPPTILARLAGRGSKAGRWPAAVRLSGASNPRVSDAELLQGHGEHADALGGSRRRPQALRAEGDGAGAAGVEALAAPRWRRRLLWAQGTCVAAHCGAA